MQLPSRDDALVAHLLATAIEADESGAARQALRSATRAAGRVLGSQMTGDVDGLLRALESRGYAPISTSDGIRLRNCPFHHLVPDHLDLVCTLNRDLLAAAVTAARVGFTPHLDPRPDMCCVVLRP